MVHSLHKLSPNVVKTSEPGKHSDGGGLWLHQRESGAGQWVLRVTVHGRRREMGLGSTKDVSLKDARILAAKWRAVAAQEIDPIKQREKDRREAQRNLHILNDIARDCFESRKAELKGDGESGRWFSPLAIHVLPKLGKVPVAEIDQTDIRDALAPIWHTKAETAKKALVRLGLCMKHAAALGLDVDLQATEKARALLGAQRHKTINVPSMPWSQVPAFYATLLDGSVTHLALRMLILTGVRSGPLRHMRLDQIQGDVWTIPGEEMKGRRDATPDFRVPLAPEAMEIVEQAKRLARDGFIFPSVRKGVISDMTMGRFMERLKLEARPHGFRSSLRNWLAEATETPYEVAESCLAHVVGGTVERAYRRTDFLDQRRAVMERWAKHVTQKGSKVIQLTREA